jgi:hypothetical protein
MTGAAAMKKKFERLKEKLPDEVGRALYEETQIEEKEVVRRTPKETGDLRSTVHIVGPIREGRTVYCLILAGGPDAPYAFIVHEDLDAHHDVGQAKYIESVLMESRSFMGVRVMNRIELYRVIEGE